MKKIIQTSCLAIGLTLFTGAASFAQDIPKVKTTDEEVKIKSDDGKVKIQDEESKIKTDGEKLKVNDNEEKYKSADLKVKTNDNEDKYKSDGLKVKANDEETKIKGTVTPMRPTTVEQTELRVGETQVRTTEQVTPIVEERTTVIPSPRTAVVQQVDIPRPKPVAKKPAVRRTTALNSASRKRPVARRTSTAPRTIVRTQVVRDTVYVASPPERIVTTQKEYVRDTVVISRVDTVVRTQTTNAYSGYNVPAGDFKKIKLERKKNGEVQMKRKE